jgi:UDP-N-acetyl-D-mannosaminuronic acid transferase (WecB/TagA/CpsF family)
MPKRPACCARPIPACRSWAAATATSTVDEEDELCDEINLTQPDVIWVGLSVPTEYEFAVRNKTRLQAPDGW